MENSELAMKIAPIVTSMVGLAPQISLTLMNEKSTAFEQWCIIEDRIRQLKELIASDNETGTTNKIPGHHTNGDEPISYA